MELLQAIALLCQVTHSGGASSFVTSYKEVQTYQITCQQSYLNCVLKRRSVMPEVDALQKCVLEK